MPRKAATLSILMEILIKPNQNEKYIAIKLNT